MAHYRKALAGTDALNTAIFFVEAVAGFKPAGSACSWTAGTVSPTRFGRVVLVGTHDPLPRNEYRSKADSESNTCQEVIGVVVEPHAGPHVQLQVGSDEIDRSCDGVVPGSG